MVFLISKRATIAARFDSMGEQEFADQHEQNP